MLTVRTEKDLELARKARLDEFIVSGELANQVMMRMIRARLRKRVAASMFVVSAIAMPFVAQSRLSRVLLIPGVVIPTGVGLVALFAGVLVLVVLLTSDDDYRANGWRHGELTLRRRKNLRKAVVVA